MNTDSGNYDKQLRAVRVEAAKAKQSFDQLKVDYENESKAKKAELETQRARVRALEGTVDPDLMAEYLSIKKHTLEELPGLGKKTVTEIIEARKAGPFKDFEDLKTRVPMLKDPVKLITDRIILEISDRERRHYIFIVR